MELKKKKKSEIRNPKHYNSNTYNLKIKVTGSLESSARLYHLSVFCSIGIHVLTMNTSLCPKHFPEIESSRLAVSVVLRSSPGDL